MATTGQKSRPVDGERERASAPLSDRCGTAVFCACLRLRRRRSACIRECCGVSGREPGDDNDEVRLRCVHLALCDPHAAARRRTSAMACPRGRRYCLALCVLDAAVAVALA